jgi:hypothetical protein
VKDYGGRGNSGLFCELQPEQLSFVALPETHRRPAGLMDQDNRPRQPRDTLKVTGPGVFSSPEPITTGRHLPLLEPITSKLRRKYSVLVCVNRMRDWLTDFDVCSLVNGW